MSRYPVGVLSAAVWLVIAASSLVRAIGIWRSYYWQDDYIHIWRSWNAPAAEVIWQNWNGHREPAAFAIQWLVARLAPQVWWPSAVILCAIAVGTSVMFWLMVRRWGGVTPTTAAAAVLFAAWPATFVAQQWFSAGLETIPLLLMFVAGWLLARPGRWTPAAVGALALLAWAFHERAVYFLPFLLALALFHGGVRRNAATWWVLSVLTVVMAAARWIGGLPGRDGDGDLAGSLWNAGPGSLLRSVLGWLPFEAHTVVPSPVGLLGLVVVVVWMVLGIIVFSLDGRQAGVVLAVVAGFFIVEVGAFAWLRGGFAGGTLASDPRFTLLTGTVLLTGLGALRIQWRPLVMGAGGLAVIGCWSVLAYPTTPGRDWFRPLPPGTQLAATPSPPQMLGHFFFTTEPPVYELGTTRTLLQVGPNQPAFPRVAQRPAQVGLSGGVEPLRFTRLVSDQRRQCGTVQVPELQAGVRVVELDLVRRGVVDGVVSEGVVYVFPAPGEMTISLDGTCTRSVHIGIPGR